jgi:RHS repeat-associated protein
MPQLSEKPHLGFATKKTAWNPGPNVCNFTVTLGLQVVVVENGVRKTYSARYYNPATGRFMSRDPNEPKLHDANGKPIDPRKLHKYLYADGDPVNLEDPTGKAGFFEWARVLTLSVLMSAGVMEESELPHVELEMEAVYESIEEVIENFPKDPKWPWWPGSGPL